MAQLVFTVGQKFGRLTVVEVARGPRGGPQPRCRCDCGAELEVRATFLARGVVRSCGCFKRDEAAQRMTRHGESTSAEYRVWTNMQQRCSNPRVRCYENYGGRGIRVCDRWLGAHGYANFLADMGRRPSPRHSIERKDNDGPYAPENCAWATPAEQIQNKRTSRLVTVGGETATLNEWARRLGIPRTTLRARLDQGMAPEIAFRRSEVA